ncbi:MAG: hypothetical protein H7839_19450 [Magnetococcus sp. YQC-5]
MNFSIPLRSATAATVAPLAGGKGGDDSGLPPGMRRVKTICKACGKSLGIKYPDAVTFWKVQCPSCAQTISIELVGGRKCLVFDVRGHKTVERIGLTDQRRRFYRAKCFSCDETLVVPEAEAGRLRGCHKCGLEYTVREDGEVYYETAVRINEEVTTYREKVQESTGYVADKNRAFFLGEEAVIKPGKAVGSGAELNAALAALQRETDFLREKEERVRVEYRQAVAEKEMLARKLALELEKKSLLEKNARSTEENESRLAGVRSQLQKVTQERDRLLEEREAQVSGVRSQLQKVTQERDRLLEERDAQVSGVRSQLQKVTQERDRLLEERDAQVSGVRSQLQKVTQERDRLLEERDAQVAGVRSLLQKVTQERDRLLEELELLKNKMMVHGEALRALDEAMAKSARLESRNATLEENVRRILDERKGLEKELLILRDAASQFEGRWQRSQEALRISVEERKGVEKEYSVLREATSQFEGRVQRAQEALRHSVEERKALEAKLQVCKEEIVRLEERLSRSEKAGPMAMQGKIRELELENGKLAAQVEEGRRVVKRIQELEREVERLRSAGGVAESDGREEWYCEEGEEACIRADNDIGMARRVLGIRGQPTPERIKTALRRRVKRYHPDMVSSLGLDLRDLAHRKMQDINRAYAILMKEYGQSK